MSLTNIHNFDLNIENYKDEELQDIFGIPSTFNHEMIRHKADVLKKMVLKDSTISQQIKNNTINFINKAHEKLSLQLPTSPILQTTENADIFNLNKTLQQSTLMPTANTNSDIIQKPNVPYIRSETNQYQRGVINPLSKRTVVNMLNIDSRFRANYYSTSASDFYCDLPMVFNNVVSMSMASFEFPTTYYNVSKRLGTNYFWVSACSPGTTNIVERLCINIQSGNYQAKDLISYINNFIKTDDAFTKTTYLKYLVFTINIGGASQNSGSGQTVVGVSSDYIGDSFFFNLDFQSDLQGNMDFSTPLPLKLAWLMGFRLGYYENNSCYISEGIIYLATPSYMFLVVDDFQNNVNDSFYSALNSSILNQNILARISCQPTTFSELQQVLQSSQVAFTNREYFGPVNIQRLHIQLIDEFGRVLDINNMDFSFCLMLTIDYNI